MILPNDYKEFIALLNGSGVKYVLVGAHALSYYGKPRTTGDIDFFIEKSSENIARLVMVMVEFGFVPGTFPAEAFEHDCVQVGFAPFRIDILTSLSGVDFDEVAATANYDVVDDLKVPIISKELLIKNKRATGRSQDLTDVAQLEKR